MAHSNDDAAQDVDLERRPLTRVLDRLDDVPPASVAKATAMSRRRSTTGGGSGSDIHIQMIANGKSVCYADICGRVHPGEFQPVLTSNPFAELSAFIPPAVMQTYVVVMILLVAGGTLLDIVHKKSARYFFDHWQNAKSRGTRQVGGGETVLVAIQAAVVDGLTSGEFCNARRRVAHLLTMYGFVAYVVATVIMVFAYPTPATPAPSIVTALWYIGALMVCVGGYWFWFFIRVDVAAEGNSPFRLVRADLFIVSLMASVTLGLIWAYIQSAGNTTWAKVFLALYLIATTVLFGSIPWSKFSHMFYKPAAAFQKRMEQANGSRRNLPAPADKPLIFGSARRQPRNY